jgi:hypothetical protein
MVWVDLTAVIVGIPASNSYISKTKTSLEPLNANFLGKDEVDFQSPTISFKQSGASFTVSRAFRARSTVLPRQQHFNSSTHQHSVVNTSTQQSYQRINTSCSMTPQDIVSVHLDINTTHSHSKAYQQGACRASPLITSSTHQTVARRVYHTSSNTSNTSTSSKGK